jgi:transcriptional regulator with XRE-family HTH domain
MRLNFERLSSELLRALRGSCSQTAFARRLGYKSNVIYSWESGRAFPTASRTLHVAARSGVVLRSAIERFYRASPQWLDVHRSLATKHATAQLLDDLRGHTTVSRVAQSAGLSRFSLQRWLEAETEPRLPDFLRVIEASSLRVLDFVSVLADPAALPSVAAQWQQLEAARTAAYDLPWSQVVLRALELDTYQMLSAHEPGWIAARVGISRQEEERCLTVLEQSQQIRKCAGKYVLNEVRTLDTRRDERAAQQVRAFWARVACERLDAGGDGLFAYNVFGVSIVDLERIQELQRAYFRELRAIVATSAPVQKVVLANLQLATLG